MFNYQLNLNTHSHSSPLEQQSQSQFIIRHKNAVKVIDEYVTLFDQAATKIEKTPADRLELRGETFDTIVKQHSHDDAPRWCTNPLQVFSGLVDRLLEAFPVSDVTIAAYSEVRSGFETIFKDLSARIPDLSDIGSASIDNLVSAKLTLESCIAQYNAEQSRLHGRLTPEVFGHLIEPLRELKNSLLEFPDLAFPDVTEAEISLYTHTTLNPRLEFSREQMKVRRKVDRALLNMERNVYSILGPYLPQLLQELRGIAYACDLFVESGDLDRQHVLVTGVNTALTHLQRFEEVSQPKNTTEYKAKLFAAQSAITCLKSELPLALRSVFASGNMAT